MFVRRKSYLILFDNCCAFAVGHGNDANVLWLVPAPRLCFSGVSKTMYQCSTLTVSPYLTIEMSCCSKFDEICWIQWRNAQLTWTVNWYCAQWRIAFLPAALVWYSVGRGCANELPSLFQIFWQWSLLVWDFQKFADFLRGGNSLISKISEIHFEIFKNQWNSLTNSFAYPPLPLCYTQKDATSLLTVSCFVYCCVLRYLLPAIA